MANPDKPVSFRLSEDTRRLLRLLAAQMTLKDTGKTYTMTDVVEKAVKDLAAKEKVK